MKNKILDKKYDFLYYIHFTLGGIIVGLMSVPIFIISFFSGEGVLILFFTLISVSIFLFINAIYNASLQRYFTVEKNVITVYNNWKKAVRIFCLDDCIITFTDVAFASSRALIFKNIQGPLYKKFKCMVLYKKERYDETINQSMEKYEQFCKNPDVLLIVQEQKSIDLIENLVSRL